LATLSVRDLRRIREGLPVETFDALKRILDLSDQHIASLLHLSPRTVGRRREEGRFAPDESDRIARLARLVDLALEALNEEQDEVRAWFKSPHALLDGETPLHYSDTEPGARAVEDILNAMRYGFAA
jgi:putative toxin-antitoxin system antitoxin component (TIGR02293 family)